MKRHGSHVCRSFVFALVAVVSAPLALDGQTRADDGPSEALRNRVEAYRASGTFRAGGETLHARTALPAFYLARDFQPGWITADGRWLPRADSALAVLGEAERHGLDGEDYHLDALQSLSARVRQGQATPLERLDAEVLLSDAMLVYGSHLLLGRVDPTRVEAEWIANRREAQLDVRLNEALGTGRVRGYIQSLVPAQPEYARLLTALADLRRWEETGGWASVDAGPTLRVDSVSPRVAVVRRRLSMSTDPAERALAQRGSATPNRFDAGLSEAVSRFQVRHGLEPDGAVGARTREAMNVSARERIVQLEVNLERWRWLPEQLGTRHIRVNIAAFETEVWDQGRVAMNMRSIVGRQYRMTPSFNSTMRYLVLAPYWHVPPTIAAVDKLPLIRQDPGYVSQSRMTLFSAATNTPVDPATIDWTGVTGPDFNRQYRLRQDPGPANALGNVKFMFPNRHNVYLHDTPQRELFAQAERGFSSGCIRLENPLELAEYLLSDQLEWNPDRIRQVVAQGQERSVNLREPVPVYLLYFTAFVEDDGTVHFRSDIYGRDGAVLNALNGDPPGP